MKTFILKDGGKASINGLTYVAGDAVNSNTELVSLFPNRFVVAPAGIVGTKWPIDVNDVAKAGKYAVLSNRDCTFRVVDAEGNTVAGCDHMLMQNAIEKYQELVGTEKKANKLAAPVTKATVPTDDEDDESDDGGSDDSGDEDDESDEDDEKPAKKIKKVEKTGKKKSKK